MKITLKVKLTTTDEQSRTLFETMETFNKTCDWISGKAFEAKIFNAYDLHYLVYSETRTLFPKLPSQSVIRAIAKVSDRYKTDRKVRHFFKEHSAMEYDKRTLSFKDLSHASLATIHGRIRVPLVFGHYAPLDRNKMCGQADLTTSRGKFFLNIVIDLPDGTPVDPRGYPGVDLGIVALSTDSDGESFSGETADRVRENRFKKDTNHVISKRIVSRTKGTGRGTSSKRRKEHQFQGRNQSAYCSLK